jgi:hypothetical protein
MEMIRHGKLPLRVMIKNMDFYFQEALELDRRLADALAQNAKKFSAEQFIKALELYGQASDARMKAQKCACDAAPYLHPRLSQIQIDATQTIRTARDLAPSSDKEKSRDFFRQLRDSPHIVPVEASDDDGNRIPAEIQEPEDEGA